MPAHARRVRELGLLAALYVAYSLTRVVAAHDLAAARGPGPRHRGSSRVCSTSTSRRASTGRRADLGWLSVPMDYWYCALHYLVTPVVLGWLYFRRPGSLRPGPQRDRARVGLGLVGYLAFPTAPPRLMGGAYVDSLARYAHFGWWAEHASAPAGLGGLTNELAAMPSLHVGWAVWVAWASVHEHASPRPVAVRLSIPSAPHSSSSAPATTGSSTPSWAARDRRRHLPPPGSSKPAHDSRSNHHRKKPPMNLTRPRQPEADPPPAGSGRHRPAPGGHRRLGLRRSGRHPWPWRGPTST